MKSYPAADVAFNGVPPVRQTRPVLLLSCFACCTNVSTFCRCASEISDPMDVDGSRAAGRKVREDPLSTLLRLTVPHCSFYLLCSLCECREKVLVYGVVDENSSRRDTSLAGGDEGGKESTGDAQIYRLVWEDEERSLRARISMRERSTLCDIASPSLQARQ